MSWLKREELLKKCYHWGNNHYLYFALGPRRNYMISDFLLAEFSKTIKRISIPARNPGAKKYLKKTAQYPGILKSTPKSPKFGFLKVHDLLRDNAMARIKYHTVQEHLEKDTLKNKLIRLSGIHQMLGAMIRMISQYRGLREKNAFKSKNFTEDGAEQLWGELSEYARAKWNIQKIGFTEVPPDIIIEGNHILYKYALVFIDEMKKEKIDDAPLAKAGNETYRIYNHLGLAVLDIAKWLRKKGVKCQANHPLGGLVSFVPLAGKAGLGWQGMNGLLITPEFGERQRIAPIYIESPIFPFTDSLDHSWVEQFCENCKLCQKECPPDAIQDSKMIYNSEVPIIGRLARCIDPIKCYPQFAKFDGCSVCVKVCPFSKGNGVYHVLKKTIVK